MQLPIKTKVYKISMSLNIGKMICMHYYKKQNKKKQHENKSEPFTK